MRRKPYYAVLGASISYLGRYMGHADARKAMHSKYGYNENLQCVTEGRAIELFPKHFQEKS